MSANSKQIGGSHYATSGIAHWDLIDKHNVPYLAGCATKYLTRWRGKNGLQDLQKSAHYTEKMIESWVGRTRFAQSVPDGEISEFITANAVPAAEAEAIRLILNWVTVADLKVAHTWIESLIAEADGSAPGAGYVKQG